MKKIIIGALLLLMIGCLGFDLWQNRHKYFFNGEDQTFQGEKGVSTENINNSRANENTDEEKEEIDPEAEEIIKEKQIDPRIDDLDENELDNLSAKDCEDKCESLEDDDEEHELCLAYCGLSNDSEENNEGSDCNEKEDLEADSCWKNKAVQEKNGNWCEKISSEEIRESCFNRLIEEIFD